MNGTVDSAFVRVREVFCENFVSRGELGAALCVIADERIVVDLWGGIADHVSARSWSEDTIATIFSATKGATALCAHLLAACGKLDLDSPVARYWPEFAAAGKGDIAVRLLLNHQSGLAAIERRLPADAITQWDVVTAALAAQAPLWPPGSAHGYHALTFGWLVGEVVRRVSGKSVGVFFQEEIARPLGLDFWIGLPEEHEPRVARIRMAPLRVEQGDVLRAMKVPTTLTAKAFSNPPGLLRAGQVNSRAIHAAEIPAAGGIASARSLAGMYAALVRSREPLVDRDVLRRMTRVESDGDDLVLLLPTRFSAGFMKSVDNRPRDSVRMGPNEEAFGHVGAGGSIGMGDPVARLALGYVMNQLGHGVMLNERGQALIDAVYECLGETRISRSEPPG